MTVKMRIKTLASTKRTMKIKCLYCGEEFEAARATAKFCPDKSCKTLFNRSKVEPKIEETLTADAITSPQSEEKEVFVNSVTDEKHEINEKSKRTGLNYDMEEVSDSLKEKKKRCPYCGEPTWFPPCAVCSEEMRDPKIAAQRKHDGKWGEVCSLEEWEKYPIMCENKAQAKALNELYSKFTSRELVDAGIVPPKWKKYFSTYQEALEALGEAMEGIECTDSKGKVLGHLRKNKVGIYVSDVGLDQEEDYSKWK